MFVVTMHGSCHIVRIWEGLLVRSVSVTVTWLAITYQRGQGVGSSVSLGKVFVFWGFRSWQLARSYRDGYRLVIVCTYGDLIVLPHWETSCLSHDLISALPEELSSRPDITSGVART